MDEDIRKLIKLAGNLHRYQILVTILCFVFWSFAALFTNTLGFLETNQKVSYYDPALNETITATKDYNKICKFDPSNYTVVERVKYSWVIDLNIECDKTKVSLFGTFRALGAMTGSFISSLITGLLGTNNTLIVIDIFFCILVLLTFFIKNYVFYAIVILLCATSCNIILYSVMVLFGEIIDKEKKPILNVFINSGLGIGGIFFVLFFYGFKNWRYVFITDICILIVNGVLVKIFFIETPSSYFKKGNMKGFMDSIRYIAKFNKRLEIFDQEIKKPEYVEILSHLDSENSHLQIDNNQDIHQHANKYLTENQNNIEIEDNQNKIEGQVHVPIKDEHKILNQEIDHLSNTPITVHHPTPHVLFSSPNMILHEGEMLEDHTSDRKLHIDDNNNSKNKLLIQVTIIDLIKYKSVRKTFLLFCLFWLVAGMLYAGLVIGTKNLPGNIYTNNLILFCAESVGYYVSGISMNNKKLGRKGSLMMFTFGFSLMCYLMVIFINYKTLYIVLYIITRFFNMSAFVIYYTFCLESYPTSAKALAYGLNGGCNSIGGIIISFIIEYVETRWLYLIYACLGTVCGLLMIFLKETIGAQQPTNIIEMVEKKNEERKAH